MTREAASAAHRDHAHLTRADSAHTTHDNRGRRCAERPVAAPLANLLDHSRVGFLVREGS